MRNNEGKKRKRGKTGHEKEKRGGKKRENVLLYPSSPSSQHMDNGGTARVVAEESAQLSEKKVLSRSSAPATYITLLSPSSKLAMFTVRESATFLSPSDEPLCSPLRKHHLAGAA